MILSEGEQITPMLPDAKAIAEKLALQVQEFADAFYYAYDNSMRADGESIRVSEALAVEYGKHLLAIWANPPLIRILPTSE